jgi:hypothetical protein
MLGGIHSEVGVMRRGMHVDCHGKRLRPTTFRTVVVVLFLIIVPCSVFLRSLSFVVSERSSLNEDPRNFAALFKTTSELGRSLWQPLVSEWLCSLAIRLK